jgi:hypothetical protein
MSLQDLYALAVRFVVEFISRLFKGPPPPPAAPPMPPMPPTPINVTVNVVNGEGGPRRGAPKTDQAASKSKPPRSGKKGRNTSGRRKRAEDDRDAAP